MNERTLPRNVLTLSSILFCGGTAAWLITLFSGLGVYYAAVYTTPILVCLLGFLLTFILTIVKALKSGLGDVSLEVIVHLIPLTLLLVLLVDESEILKSKRVLTAYLKDDLSSMEMILRDDNMFEMNSLGPFSTTRERSGRYEMKGDTILFLVPPTANGYLPTTAIIQKAVGRVYFNRTATGHFDTTRTFLNYFEIVSE